ncbi:hypothetical protein GTCCBUS3UF5_1780 [Geobacillus thermoleovorans CCB_US3_UF5]|uniref:Uncharacterized protein n=1 Tax=Geobacillus thermoleovorans CCB_US3_UF5 TaxID=1111068 RepID=A0ABM5MD59_GEOTH|nr:hypothetical protein GTCCBUS3UF5_1780 [Geobacillus thermoleovorans CCB_US3_UF5]GAJ60193.1 hypothetical protein B23_3431 [Geobacillus thermoleovorans B23]
MINKNIKLGTERFIKKQKLKFTRLKFQHNTKLFPLMKALYLFSHNGLFKKAISKIGMEIK